LKRFLQESLRAGNLCAGIKFELLELLGGRLTKYRTVFVYRSYPQYTKPNTTMKKRKRIHPKETDESKTKDPTETNLERNQDNEEDERINKEDADNTGTDTNSDATESEDEKLKRPSKFDKNKREVDPDMTKRKINSDKTKQPRK
jgi:hypothetical protein